MSSRVKNTSKATGALMFFGNSMEVDIKSKYLIYNDIPLNSLLCECESWAITKVCANINIMSTFTYLYLLHIFPFSLLLPFRRQYACSK